MTGAAALVLPFGLPVGECDFGLQRQCENLLRRLQCVQLNLLQNAAGLRAVALLNALVGSCRAQLGGLFGVALLSLLQQLLVDACGVRGSSPSVDEGSWSRLRAGWRRRGRRRGVSKPLVHRS